MMTQPDLLVTWIKHCDYPIFRRFLKQYRDYFGKVFLYFSEHNRFPYFDHFIHDALIKDGAGVNIFFADPMVTDWGTQDWRNVSTNAMLRLSKSEWVCSIEQDFFTSDWHKLLGSVSEASHTSDLIGLGHEESPDPVNHPLLRDYYIHPSFWFMKRQALELTRKNFSAVPTEGADHFSLITRDAKDAQMKITRIQELGFKDLTSAENTDAFHLGGVNQNYLNVFADNWNLHRPEIFFVYNYFSGKLPVPQSEDFMKLITKVNESLSKKYPVPESSPWAKFFNHYL